MAENALYVLTQAYATALIQAVRQGMRVYLPNLADGQEFEYGYNHPAFIASLEANIFRFSAAKSLVQVQILNQLFRESTGWHDFKSKADRLANTFQKAWMQTEYHTAISVGESAAQYHRLRSQAEIFPFWKYVTVADGRVRPQHAALHGLVLPFNDPKWNSIYPPNDWNCRCRVEPLTRGDVQGINMDEQRQQAKAYTQSPEFTKSKNNGFAVNRAQLGQVFTENQLYTRKFPGMAAKGLGTLKHTNWGLPDIDKVQRTQAMPVFNEPAQNFWAQIKGTEQVASITDYTQKPVTVSRESFDQHTTNQVKSRQYRTQYLMAMQETLLHPDEVWINNQAGNNWNNMVYIKHYTGESIAVVAEMDVYLGIRLRSWFPLVEGKKSIVNNYRRGVLVHKKSTL